MKSFTVNFTMNCSGTIQISAHSEDEAKRLVEEWPLSELARQADTGDVEVLEVKWEGL